MRDVDAPDGFVTAKIILACLASVLACSPSPPPAGVAPSPPPRPALGAEDAGTTEIRTDAGTPAPPLEAGSASAAAPDAGPPPFKERTVACGGHLCDVDREVCCGGGEVGTCGPRVVKQTAASFEEIFGAQVQACGSAFPAFCDDSSDCGAGERCCVEPFTSDNDVTVCRRGACTRMEICVPERPCRTPHTSCIAGVCRRTDVRIPCDAHTCTGATPLCCIDRDRGTRSCVASCPSFGLACTRAADCSAGQVCQHYGEQSWCTSVPDIANASVLCASDADCPKALCAFSTGKPHCKSGQCECR